jgi:hypothetical protein
MWIQVAFLIIMHIKAYGMAHSKVLELQLKTTCLTFTTKNKIRKIDNNTTHGTTREICHDHQVC